MRHLIIPVLLLTFAIFGCKKENLDFNLGEELEITFKQEVTVNDNAVAIDIQFVDLIEDSRCPQGANCFWAGRAVVELKIDAQTTMVLGIGDLSGATDTPYVSFSDYGDYTITLLKVDFGRDNHQGKAEKYTVTIRVDKR